MVDNGGFIVPNYTLLYIIDIMNQIVLDEPNATLVRICYFHWCTMVHHFKLFDLNGWEMIH
jgi:hypothetical protein